MMNDVQNYINVICNIYIPSLRYCSINFRGISTVFCNRENPLKGHCDEIFRLRRFFQTTSPDPKRHVERLFQFLYNRGVLLILINNSNNNNNPFISHRPAHDYSL